MHVLEATGRSAHVAVELADRLHLLHVENVRRGLVFNNCRLLRQPLAEWLERARVGREAAGCRILTLPLGQLEVDEQHFRAPARCIIFRRLPQVAGTETSPKVLNCHGWRNHELLEPLAEQSYSLFDQ